MELSPDQITIAITVFDRREYLPQAIESALDQTTPARVIVVEDCGPDPTLASFIQARFGSRVEYFRNTRRRGLFDNWNACIELCGTPWLSILHDDDFLQPGFIAAMQELARLAPGRSLYFGHTEGVDQSGQPLTWFRDRTFEGWREVDLMDAAYSNPLNFPGQLFRTACARSMGGFRPTSQYCGDWEMWFNLALRGGAAQSGKTVACVRHHSGTGRGTNKVERSGRKFTLENVQRKRNLALLQSRGVSASFDRTMVQRQFPMPIKYILAHAVGFTPRQLAYNLRLLNRSKSPHWRYRAMQKIIGLFGVPFVHAASVLWRLKGRS